MNKPKLKRAADGKLLVERFSFSRRIEHAFGIVVFGALLLTGLPQKFDSSDFGAWLIQAFGGLENTRFVHRVTGIVFTVHAILHLVVAFVGVLTGRLRAAMMPVPQDLKDAKDNLDYFFGYRAKPPKLPKYDYRQKFEYVGMVLGGLIMVFSGLALMFPVELAQFLPAMLIPAALVAHSSEAVLAMLVLIVWHIYTVVLSPDVFPIDGSMFSGYMPVEDLRHHHRREYERLFPDGVPEIDGEPPAEPPATPRQQAPLTGPQKPATLPGR